MLQRLCAQRAIDCRIADEYRANGDKVSASRIRALLLDGEAEEAAALLGRPFSFSGIVRHGKALGRTLGFPTLNVPLPDTLRCPAPGVYICRVLLRGAWHAVRVELLAHTRPMRAFESWAALAKQVDSDKENARDWFLSRPDGLF